MTKKERLDAYRVGIKASAQVSRFEMANAGDKASAIVVAMMMTTKADSKDADALTDLIVPLQKHVFKFNHHRRHHFKSLEACNLPDEDLQRELDEVTSRRALDEADNERVKLIANKMARRSRKAVRK